MRKCQSGFYKFAKQVSHQQNKEQRRKWIGKIKRYFQTYRNQARFERPRLLLELYKNTRVVLYRRKTFNARVLVLPFPPRKLKVKLYQKNPSKTFNTSVGFKPTPRLKLYNA
jgi:hypothetical protein